jgi:drug/metabolite transporter (DMT)-like permease
MWQTRERTSLLEVEIRQPEEGNAGEHGRASPASFLVVLALATLYLTWSSTFLAIRLAIQTIPPGLMAGVRSMTAGALLYTVLRWRGAPRPHRRDWWTALIVGSGIICGGNGTITYAERFIPSGTTAVIITLTPAMMAVFGWFGGVITKPRAPVWIGINLATYGMVVAIQPDVVGSLPGQLGSIGLLLAGEIVWSVVSLYAARVRQTSPPFLMASMQMLCGGAFMLLIGLTRGELAELHLHSITGQSLLAMAYLTAAGSIAGFSAYIWLLRNVDATRVATYAYVNPMVAVLLGWLIAGEKLKPELFVGGILVVLGVALIVSFPSRRVVSSARHG